jgi:ribosomal protein L29
MDMKDIQKKKDTDIVKLLAEKREALRKARFAMHGSSGKDVKELRETRKDVARLMTELRSRQLRANDSAA